MDRPRRAVNVLTGLIIPALLVAGGIYCIVTRDGVLVGESMMGGWYSTLHVYGSDALALGIAAISLAIAMHCAFIWGRMERTWVIAHVLGLPAIVVGLISFLYVLFHVGYRMFTR